MNKFIQIGKKLIIFVCVIFEIIMNQLNFPVDET